jgi:hypothetical protein
MSISSYSKKLIQNLESDPERFVDYYLEDQQSIIDELSRSSYLNTDFTHQNPETTKDWLKFSLIFSDITFLNLGLGVGGTLVNAHPLVEGITIPPSIAISKKIKTKFEKGQFGVAYAGVKKGLPASDELLSTFRTLEPCINSGTIILRPERVVVVPVKEQKHVEHKDGTFTPHLITYKIFQIDPNSPIQNWMLINEKLRQRSLPIQSGDMVPSYEAQLFKISLPYLDGIEFSTLAKIIDDEQDHLTSLRAALKRSISEVPKNKNLVSEISNDVISPEISKINRRFKTITQTHSLRIAGACVSTAALSLVALTNEGWIAAIATFLGAGGIGLIANEYSEYIKSKAEETDNPYYLFWRLKSSKRRKK